MSGQPPAYGSAFSDQQQPGYGQAPPGYGESGYGQSTYGQQAWSTPAPDYGGHDPYKPPEQHGLASGKETDLCIPGDGYHNTGYTHGQSPYADSPRQSEEPIEDYDDVMKFTEKSIRLGFVRKVFGILAVQLIITGAFIAMFMYWDDLAQFSRDHNWLYIAACVATVVLVIAMACIGDIRRKSPINYILLMLYTLCMSWMLGSISSYYEADEVLMAVGIVTAVVIGACLLGFQTKFDFTPLLGICFVLTICLIMFGIFAAIFNDRILNIVYASIGALLFSVWLVIDIQLIMGGKHKIQMDPEEYIFAALNLYIDIVNIFLYILMIIGSSKN